MKKSEGRGRKHKPRSSFRLSNLCQTKRHNLSVGHIATKPGFSVTNSKGQKETPGWNTGGFKVSDGFETAHSYDREGQEQSYRYLTVTGPSTCLRQQTTGNSVAQEGEEGSAVRKGLPSYPDTLVTWRRRQIGDTLVCPGGKVLFYCLFPDREAICF